ncbi:MAG: UvrD-helicase domain-containing protein [Acidobacteria bacterium]|nr:UvrD-helicase domain-containing protein [Acidobacteriota bacterium]
MTLLDKLNPQQREAVEATEGPLLILAGAGSGKTRVIAYRIAYLMDYGGVPAENILAVTFTNKAAEEMRSRVEQMVRLPGLTRPWISTFHSFCVRILRQDGPRIGLPKGFSIYDEADQLSVVKSCLRRLGLTEREVTPRAVLSRISYAKNHGRSPETFYQDAADPVSEKVAVVYDLYAKALREAGAMDFDDLLLEAVRLLRDDAEAALKYNERFRYILVDEYQDTNRTQYELVRLLTQRHQNLCVVGDEDQSIYSWRGADIRNIIEFEKDYPQARIIRLEQNYRSTQNILDAALAVVANNLYRKGKTLRTEHQGGEKIGFYQGLDGENESLFVADWIARRRRDRPEEHVAILYRSNAQSRLYEEALRRYTLKYNVVGGISFYERAEVKDLLSYLKAARNPQDSVSLLRIINSPPRGIGQATVHKLEEMALESGTPFWEMLRRALEEKLFAPRALSALQAFYDLMEELRRMASENSVPEILRTILDRTGYIKVLEEESTPEAYGRVENIEELLNAATDSQERGETLPEFLDHAALVADTDSYDERAPLTLMTLHSAKGLEFPVVFLVGMEEGLLPHSRSLLSASALEEERRLCYVGMTRAEEILILTRALARRHYGNQMEDTARPSRFLREIPQDLLEDFSEPIAPPTERRYEYERTEGTDAPEGAEGTESDEEASRAIALDNARQFFGLPGARGRPVPRRRSSATGFAPGNRVRHPKFGYGTVLRSEGQGDETKLTISFPSFGLKKLIEKYADLERV